MNQLLPDWMFAAFAIGAWSVGSWVYTHWHWAPARWIAIGLIVICALVVGVRYISRWLRRMKSPEVHDPDEWKQY